MKKKLSIFVMLLILVAVFTAPAYASAATTGSTLNNPEAGWQRYDDQNNKFYYYGSWTFQNLNSTAFWLGDYMQGEIGNTTSVKFAFYGTKFRIIQQIASIRSNNVQVKIDGVVVGNYSLYDPTLTTPQCLVYEKIGLAEGNHYIELTNINTAKTMAFDAVDIDSNGYFIDTNQPLNLKVSSENSKISLSWDPVEGVTSYNLKYGTITGVYTNTVTVTGTTITLDTTSLTPGIMYYFTVSSFATGKESSNSNEVSATLSGHRAILEITFNNGNVKEYDLSASEIDAFIAWFDLKSEGIGKSYFSLPKYSNVKPFISRREYIKFDTIESFEIKDYKDL